MNNTRRTMLAAACLALSSNIGWAQDKFPSRPVTIVVPFPAGGVVDVVARLIRERMSTSLGVPVVIDNKAGAGGTIGAAHVAKATPDGHTVLLGGSATQVFGPAIYKNIQYDALRDFAPVGQISSGPLVLVVGPQLPAKSVPDLVSHLRAQNDRALYASNGNGTFPHLAGELFKQSNDLSTAHVPYKGGPAATTALLAGDVAFSINHIPVVQGMVKAERLRALATTGKSRSVVFPELPTLDETGMKGFEANAWWGLFVPAGAPAYVVDALNKALGAALEDESVRAGLVAQGDEVHGGSAAAFAAYLEAETAKWKKVVETARLRVD